MRILPLLLVALLDLTACGGHAAPPAPAMPAYTELDPGLTRLRDDFNADTGKVRLLYIVGPTCPECLRGMDDLGKALAADQDEPQLRTLVVYVPALGATAGDIADTIPLMPGKFVSRYWDPSGASGRMFDGVLKTGGFAWDVWMIYGPGQRWDGTAPPVPDYWMDQLDGSPSGRHLDAATFAKQVAEQLARLKATSGR